MEDGLLKLIIEEKTFNIYQKRNAIRLLVRMIDEFFEILVNKGSYRKTREYIKNFVENADHEYTTNIYPEELSLSEIFQSDTILETRKEDEQHVVVIDLDNCLIKGIYLGDCIIEIKLNKIRAGMLSFEEYYDLCQSWKEIKNRGVSLPQDYNTVIDFLESHSLEDTNEYVYLVTLIDNGKIVNHAYRYERDAAAKMRLCPGSYLFKVVLN